MEQKPVERSVREVREHFADVINDAVRGQVTYVTSRGRLVATIGPPPPAAADEERDKR
jgi:antitoxin (DNA-binding transcriptional repressor) of toxin-antitoxin stability system